jgi:hypothetical protein
MSSVRSGVHPVGEEIAGAPEGIRTPDPQIRSLVLYPAELPAPKGGQGYLNLWSPPTVSHHAHVEGI